MHAHAHFFFFGGGISSENQQTNYLEITLQILSSDSRLVTARDRLPYISMCIKPIPVTKIVTVSNEPSSLATTTDVLVVAPLPPPCLVVVLIDVLTPGALLAAVVVVGAGLRAFLHFPTGIIMTYRKRDGGTLLVLRHRR